MPGAELTTSVRDGRVVVALRGDPDVTAAAVLSTAACGAHCAPWEGSVIAYCHRVIAAAAAAAAALTGPLRGRMRR
jgi:Na+/H+ antiporter NhaC